MTERMTGPAAPSEHYLPVEVTGQPYDPNGESLAGDSWASLAAGGDQPIEDLQLPSPTPDAAARGDRTRAARRWRLIPRTLTARLVTGVVLLVIVVVAVAGATTYASLGRFLADRLDQQVSTRAGQARPGLSRCVNSTFDECFVAAGAASGTTVGSGQTTWVNILDPNGTPRVANSNSSDLVVLQLTDSQWAKILRAPNQNRTVTTASGASVRINVQPISDGYLGVVGLSTQDESKTLHTLLLLELAIGAGAVLLALGATTLGVRLSLRPLHRVTATARAVAVELSPEGAGLERRVPVSDTEIDTEAGQLAESVNTLLGAVGSQFAARVESERRMRQFMADASHELRTPLTSIRGYAELARMQRALDGEDSGASRDRDTEALDRIESEGTRMSRLVDDLLTLARGDIGAPIESEPVFVAELIEQSVEGARAAYPGRQISFSCPPDLVTRGDHDELLRVVRNLLTNAAVHTAPNRPILVTGNADHDSVIIQVVDAGPGLAPEQAAHVFERFWRSDSSRSRISGGSGLGLAIVASIVAAHGGVVWFDSSVDAGSTVTVQLPAY